MSQSQADISQDSSEQAKKIITSRRTFLRRSILLGAGAAGVASISNISALPQTGEAGQPAIKKPAKDGYRVTKHIAEYYKTAAL